jgi:hypothetical protein
MSGLIAYSVSVGDGVWQVPLWGAPNDHFWYIHNTRTGKYVKIGRVKSRGSNNYDLAVSEAKRLNAEIREKQQAALDELVKMEW